MFYSIERSCDILTTEHSINKQLQKIVKHNSNGESFIPLSYSVCTLKIIFRVEGVCLG